MIVSNIRFFVQFSLLHVCKCTKFEPLPVAKLLGNWKILLLDYQGANIRSARVCRVAMEIYPR